MNATDEKGEHLSIYDTRQCTSTHRQMKEGEWEAVWMRHRGDWKAEEHNLGFKLVISTTDQSSLQSCYLDVSRVDICSYLATADIKKMASMDEFHKLLWNWLYIYTFMLRKRGHNFLFTWKIENSLTWRLESPDLYKQEMSRDFSHCKKPQQIIENRLTENYKKMLTLTLMKKQMCSFLVDKLVYAYETIKGSLESSFFDERS